MITTSVVCDVAAGLAAVARWMGFVAATRADFVGWGIRPGVERFKVAGREVGEWDDWAMIRRAARAAGRRDHRGDWIAASLRGDPGPRWWEDCWGGRG